MTCSEDILNGAADVGFASLPVYSPALQVTELFEDELVLVVHRGNTEPDERKRNATESIRVVGVAIPAAMFMTLALHRSAWGRSARVILAPFSAVPLPGGRPTPSGPTLMSQPAI